MSLIIPNSPDAEMGVLSSGLIDPQSVGDIVQNSTTEHFYSVPNQTIYTEMVAMWQENIKWDLFTFQQRLRDKNLLKPVGGEAYITNLFLFVPSSANLPTYLETLRDKYLLRQVISTCDEARKRAYEEQYDVTGLVLETQAKLNSLTDSKAKDSKTIKEWTSEAFQEIQDAHESGKIPGLKTGLIDLDRKLGGLRPKQLIILAADTSQGKTAFGLNVVEYNAITMGIPCGVVSLEMSGTELSHRLIASAGRIDLHNFITTRGNDSDIHRIAQTTAKIAASPIYIRDDSDVDALKLRAIGRQMKHENQIQLLLVDYIQLLTPQSTKDENRERAMATAAHALKQMGKELDIVIIALSQLNEQGRLRESRAIGHHADKVMTITHEEDEPSTIHINKNRSGPTGSVAVTFIRKYARFESVAKDTPLEIIKR